MTTPSSSAVRTAWDTYVLQSDTVQAFTPNTFLYRVLDDSEANASLLYHETVLNFLVVLVQRFSEPKLSGSTRYQFQVRVEYYLQQTDVAGSTFNTVQDRIEAIDDLVPAALDVRWGDTVDYYEGGRPIDVQAVKVGEKTCWRGGFVYTAFKTS